MLSMASFPPDREAIGQWFAGHTQEWNMSAAYRFAVEHQHRFIGLVDIDTVDDGEGTLGYWFERSAWGQGHASEAAAAVVRFAFDVLRLRSLRAGHAADNEASRNVLLKLGFQPINTTERLSRPRGEVVAQLRYVLSRAHADLQGSPQLQRHDVPLMFLRHQ